MALEGSLKDFGLADIFQLIYVQKKTGILKLKHASNEAKVLFENGLIVTADSSNAEGMNKIGELLLRSGKITHVQLKDAIAIHRKTKEVVGVILVEMGAVTKDELIKALGYHVKEAVFSLFQWKEGRYSFEAADVSYQRDYWPPINTEFLIMEGVRRIDEWPFIEKKIPSLSLVFEKIKENQDKVKAARNEEESLDDMFGEAKKEEGIRITQDEMTIYNLVDGRQDVRNLIEISNLGEFETCKGLSNLLTGGLIVQCAHVETEKIEAKKSGGLRERLSGLTVRHVISAIVVIGCFFIMFASVKNITKTLNQAIKITGFYHELKRYNQLKQIRFSIFTYSYRNKILPASLELLIREGYPMDSSIEAVGREVLYEPDNTQSLFNLSPKK